MSSNHGCLYSILLILAAASCGPRITPTGSPTAASELPASVVPARTEGAEATRTVSPTPPASATPPIVELEGEITLRCPSNAITRMSSLGIRPDWALLASSEIAEDMRRWQIIDQQGEMTPLQMLDNATEWTSFAGVSPNRRSVAYFTVGQRNELLDLWVSSTSGGESTLLAEGFQRRHVLEWISDEAIAVFDGGGGPWYSTWLIINTANGEQRTLPSIWLELAHAFSPDGSKLIYLDLAPEGGREFRLREFETGSDYRVFPWVHPDRIQQRSNVWIQWTTDGVSLALMDSRSLTIALNVAEESLTAETTSATSLTFPREATTWGMSSFAPDSTSLPIWRGYGEYFADPETEWELFLLDTADWRLYDYCLTPEWKSPNVIETSPDGRFLSISRIHVGEVGTMVLDSMTGRRAYLPGLGVWGWIVTTP